MDAVEKDVRLLVKKELRAANQNFPMFHSAHEGVGCDPGGNERSGSGTLSAGQVD